jgi:hypothetical protein
LLKANFVCNILPHKNLTGSQQHLTTEAPLWLVTSGENPPNHILVELNIESQSDLFRDTRTTPRWIPLLHFDNRCNDFRAGPFWNTEHLPRVHFVLPILVLCKRLEKVIVDCLKHFMDVNHVLEKLNVINFREFIGCSANRDHLKFFPRISKSISWMRINSLKFFNAFLDEWSIEPLPNGIGNLCPTLCMASS